MEGWVSIDTAAEASRIDVQTLRQWAATGAIDIKHRGTTELVRLDRVKHLSASRSFPAGRPERSSLQGLLRDAEVADSNTSVAELQELARRRG
ncbi:MAG TPA: hypothetical protein VFA25_08130 [Actinomycetota bacterium]|jgi:hypothetical protein|nr:hypothetical protein [Actinomycetota bacterium]